MEAMVNKKKLSQYFFDNQNYKVGNQWIDGLMDQLDRWFDGLIDGWMDDSIDGLMD